MNKTLFRFVCLALVPCLVADPAAAAAFYAPAHPTSVVQIAEFNSQALTLALALSLFTGIGFHRHRTDPFPPATTEIRSYERKKRGKRQGKDESPERPITMGMAFGLERVFIWRGWARLWSRVRERFKPEPGKVWEGDAQSDPDKPIAYTTYKSDPGRINFILSMAQEFGKTLVGGMVNQTSQRIRQAIAEFVTGKKTLQAAVMSVEPPHRDQVAAILISWELAERYKHGNPGISDDISPYLIYPYLRHIDEDPADYLNDIEHKEFFKHLNLTRDEALRLLNRAKFEFQAVRRSGPPAIRLVDTAAAPASKDLSFNPIVDPDNKKPSRNGRLNREAWNSDPGTEMRARRDKPGKGGSDESAPSRSLSREERAWLQGMRGILQVRIKFIDTEIKAKRMANTVSDADVERIRKVVKGLEEAYKKLDQLPGSVRPECALTLHFVVQLANRLETVGIQCQNLFDKRHRRHMNVYRKILNSLQKQMKSLHQRVESLLAVSGQSPHNLSGSGRVGNADKPKGPTRSRIKANLRQDRGPILLASAILITHWLFPGWMSASAAIGVGAVAMTGMTQMDRLRHRDLRRLLSAA